MAPVNPKEWLARARRAEKAGNAREAASLYATIGAYLRKKGRTEDAKPFIERALKLTPHSARLYLHLALCEALLSRTAAAEAAMDRFARYALRKKKVAEYAPLMETLLEQHPRLRQRFYTELMRVDRTSAEPFLGNARAAEQLQDWDGAKEMLISALKTRTHREDVLATLKRVLERMGADKALAAVERFENGKLAQEDLLVLLQERRKKKRGLTATDAEVPVVAPLPEKEKELPDLIRELEAEIGIDLEEKHDQVVPLVKEFRRRSNTIIGSDSKTRLDMAMAFFEMGLYEDAREELSLIPSTDPLHLDALLFLSQIQLAEGAELAALETLQSCLRSDRASADVRVEAKYRLSHLYFKLGDLAQAFRHATELFEEAPDYRDIRLFRNQLERMVGRTGS